MESVYLKKIKELESDLSALLGDGILFKGGEERSVLFEQEALHERVRLSFYYVDRNERLAIYLREHELNTKEPQHVLDATLNAYYQKAYFEIFRYVLFAEDSFGEIKDLFGNDINFISFKTFARTGLTKIKNR